MIISKIEFFVLNIWPIFRRNCLVWILFEQNINVYEFTGNAGVNIKQSIIFGPV